MKWTNKNAGLHPADPDYDPDYDIDADYDAYEKACIEREELKREEQG